jgi:hypothetical protein
LTNSARIVSLRQIPINVPTPLRRRTPLAAGLFEAIKYDPYNVHAQCENCNVKLEGNPRAYAVALEKRFGLGILRTLERRAKLYFDYTVPLLERMTGATKLGPHEYFILYESLRPKEEREVPVAKAA